MRALRPGTQPRKPQFALSAFAITVAYWVALASGSLGRLTQTVRCPRVCSSGTSSLHPEAVCVDPCTRQKRLISSFAIDGWQACCS